MKFFGQSIAAIGIFAMLTAFGIGAFADDNGTPQVGSVSAADGSTSSSQSAATDNLAPPQESADIQNTRMKSYVGSTSKWSGHFNFTYNGGPLTNPLGATAPNPTNVFPAPQVYLTGTMALHDRLNATTSLSLGTGLQLNTPFNAPTGLSVSDPYLGFNKLLTTGPIQHYVQIQTTAYTDSIYNGQFGYLFGVSLNDQSYYVYKHLTVGFNFWAQANDVSTSSDYPSSQQDVWFIGGGPYAEYSFSEKLSLRSVLGIEGDHYRALSDGDLAWENIYQTLGLGWQVNKPLYLYIYALASPYSGSFTTSNSQFGFNALINVF